MKKYMIEQKGRSMIEMLGVLAIVGVLSVAGIAGYSKAMAKYKTNKVIDEVSTIAANVKTMFAASGVYSELTGLSVAYGLGLIPEEMTKACELKNDGTLKSDTCVVNGLGGGVELTGATDSFTLKMKGLTQEACVAMVTSDWGGSAGFRHVKPNSGTAVTPTTSPADAFTAAEGCEGAGSVHTVEWVFY